jgi:hypothetical protein
LKKDLTCRTKNYVQPDLSSVPARPSAVREMKELANQLQTAPRIHCWSHYAHPYFVRFWIATIASNLGTWMQDAGESWLMVSLTKSPILVALVETAGSLPVVLEVLSENTNSKKLEVTP